MRRYFTVALEGDEPKADDLPKDDKSSEAPKAEDTPPVEDPPKADEVPADPPADTPKAEDPPADVPAVDAPKANETPAAATDTPPADPAPADVSVDIPADGTPAADPAVDPATDAPAGEVPAGDTPTGDASVATDPAVDPAAADPATPVIDGEAPTGDAPADAPAEAVVDVPALAPGEGGEAVVPTGDAADHLSEIPPLLDEAGDVISMEEEAIVQQEADQAASDVASELGEVERIIETSDSLEDMAAIASSIKAATPTEIALVNNTANMAVAGSDIEPEKIIPAMEQYLGKRIATEGIRETAAQIWANVQKFLSEIWTKIKAYFVKALSAIPRLESTIEALEKKVESIDKGKLVPKKGDDGQSRQISFMFSANTLAVAGKAVKTEGDLRTAISNLTTAAEYVYGPYLKSVSARGETIAKIISEFDATEPEAAATKLRAALKSSALPQIPHSTSSSAEFVTGQALLGCVNLVGTKVIDDNDSSSVLGALDHYRNARVELAATKSNASMTTAVVIDVMSPQGMKAILKELKDLLKVLEGYKSKMAKDMEDAKDAVKAASANATKELAKLKDSNESGLTHQPVAVNYYRSMMNFNAAFARWAQSPAIPMCSHSLKTIRAVLTVVEKSCNRYTLPASVPAMAKAA